MGSEESRPQWVDWIESGDLEQLRRTQINVSEKWRDSQSDKTKWLPCVQLILEKAGGTALETCCYSWSPPFFEYTPLGFAVDLDEKPLILALLRAGASHVGVSKVNGKELTPSQIAKEYDKPSYFDAMRDFKGGNEKAALIV